MLDDFVLSECLLIKIGNRSEIVSLKEIMVIGGLKPFEVYPDILEEAAYDFTCLVRVYQCL